MQVGAHVRNRCGAAVRFVVGPTEGARPAGVRVYVLPPGEAVDGWVADGLAMHFLDEAGEEVAAVSDFGRGLYVHGADCRQFTSG